jgi:hypothetical protein
MLSFKQFLNSIVDEYKNQKTPLKNKPNPLLENYIKKFKYKFRDAPKLPIRL